MRVHGTDGLAVHLDAAHGQRVDEIEPQRGDAGRADGRHGDLAVNERPRVGQIDADVVVAHVDPGLIRVPGERTRVDLGAGGYGGDQRGEDEERVARDRTRRHWRLARERGRRPRGRETRAAARRGAA